MRAVTLDIVQDELPGSGSWIKSQGDLAPPAERAYDFHRGWWRRLIGRNRPTEDLGEAGPLFVFVSLGAAQKSRYEPLSRRSSRSSALVFTKVGDAIDHKTEGLIVICSPSQCAGV
jgi:hypothetical protein